MRCVYSVMTCSLAAALSVGCTSDDLSLHGREVSLGEFANPTAATPATAVNDTKSDAADVKVIPDSTDEKLIKDDEDPSAEEPSSSSTEDLPPLEPGKRWVVDSLLGQINGRPVFASELLEPIADQLKAIASRSDIAEAEREFITVLRKTFNDWINSELVLAQAESSLTEQQQRGVIAFMRNFQEEVIAERGGGTRAEAEKSLRENLGLTVDEYLQRQRQGMLFSDLLRRKIDPRVIVSWRDIEREYQLQWDEYHAPGKILLSRIALNAQQEKDKIKKAKTMLGQDKPFEQVAESVGIDDGGVWKAFPTESGTIEDTALLPQLRSVLVGLDVGETAGPIPFGSDVLWLHIEQVEEPASRSIYEPDVQLELSAAVERKRRSDEEQRYISSLRELWVADDIEDMQTRFITIARDRYWQR